MTNKMKRKLNENNYKNILNKVRSAAHLKGIDPNEAVKDFLAKSTAIADINREIAKRREKEGFIEKTDDDFEKRNNYSIYDLNRPVNADLLDKPLYPNCLDNDLNENKKQINMKNRIRLTESQLHRVIKESVKKVLSEGKDVWWCVQYTNNLQRRRGEEADPYGGQGDPNYATNITFVKAPSEEIALEIAEARICRREGGFNVVSYWPATKEDWDNR